MLPKNPILLLSIVNTKLRDFYSNFDELCQDLDESLVLKPEIKDYDEYSKDELTKHELALFGFYISNHPTS